MIDTIKSLCQITENSSNMHFLLTDLNTLSVSLKAVDTTFLQPHNQYVVCMQVVV